MHIRGQPTSVPLSSCVLESLDYRHKTGGPSHPLTWGNSIPKLYVHFALRSANGPFPAGAAYPAVPGPQIREIEAFKTGSTGACVHQRTGGSRISVLRRPRPYSTLSRAPSQRMPSPALHLHPHPHPLSRLVPVAASPPPPLTHATSGVIPEREREKRAATAGPSKQPRDRTPVSTSDGAWECECARCRRLVVAWPIRQNRVPTPPTPTPASRCSPPTRAMLLLLDLLLTEPVQARIPLRRLPHMPMPMSTTLTACPWPPT